MSVRHPASDESACQFATAYPPAAALADSPTSVEPPQPASATGPRSSSRTARSGPGWTPHSMPAARAAATPADGHRCLLDELHTQQPAARAPLQSTPPWAKGDAVAMTPSASHRQCTARAPPAAGPGGRRCVPSATLDADDSALAAALVDGCGRRLDERHAAALDALCPHCSPWVQADAAAHDVATSHRPSRPKVSAASMTCTPSKPPSMSLLAASRGRCDHLTAGLDATANRAGLRSSLAGEWPNHKTLEETSSNPHVAWQDPGCPWTYRLVCSWWEPQSEVEKARAAPPLEVNPDRGRGPSWKQWEGA